MLQIVLQIVLVFYTVWDQLSCKWCLHLHHLWLHISEADVHHCFDKHAVIELAQQVQISARQSDAVQISN